MMGASDWIPERTNLSGPADRVARFDRAARAFAACQRRHRDPINGAAGCPLLVAGWTAGAALRSHGFDGPVERRTRGRYRHRLVAYLDDTSDTRHTDDSGPPLILLMDWDRTGGRLQTALRDRLQALDVPIDEDLRRILLRAMKPEGRTVESIAPYAPSLLPLIRAYLEEE